MSGFSLSCTALLGTNKAGTLKPDADGYYTVVLGALDVFNSSGAYYPEASAKHLFQQSASLMRRIASGNLRGEYGHPRPQPGMTSDDWVNRVRDIYEPNVCMHIRKVTVDYTTFRNKQGQPVITIVGEVRPSGPQGPALKEQFENPHEDVCFSIRSLTNDDFQFGRVTKHLKLIVTWDYVNEPGLAQAHKWNSPALEAHGESKVSMDAEARSLVEQLILPGQLMAMNKRMRSTGVAMESDGGVSMESIIEAITTEPEAKRPISARW